MSDENEIEEVVPEYPEIGRTGTYRVLRLVPSVGLFLAVSDLEVLLPNKYIEAGVEEGDEIEVFIYTDSLDRAIATTQVPKVEAEEFASLTVTDVNSIGAFLDWGLEKELMLPYGNQLRRVDKGDQVVVYVYQDKHSSRVVATTKFRKYLKKAKENFIRGEEVNVLVVAQAAQGMNVLVEGGYAGFLHIVESEEFLGVGDEAQVYVQRLRDDGNLDLTFRRGGRKAIRDASEVLLESIKEMNGKLNLGDKSSPAEVQEALGISKKIFKRALGSLYKKGLVEPGPYQVLLVTKPITKKVSDFPQKPFHRKR